MSEFFLELFSEEIPSRLQINARNDLTQILKKFFDDNEIILKGKINRSGEFKDGAGGGTDSAPPTPIDNRTSESNHWDAMLAAKRKHVSNSAGAHADRPV